MKIIFLPEKSFLEKAKAWFGVLQAVTLNQLFCRREGGEISRRGRVMRIESKTYGTPHISCNLPEGIIRVVPSVSDAEKIDLKGNARFLRSGANPLHFLLV